ncbi:MAG: NupC/NupG family nucleoside CNT transporter [candidate division Zixibacteria bacterium]|nr:NupC/NupG family nucleoside CNT transporter [candidate division Zixibacteria bacterium]
MFRFMGIIGILVLVGLAYLMSTNRRRIDWRPVIWGFGLQIVFAILILKTSPGQWLFSRINDFVLAILSCTEAGSEFVFGNLIRRFVEVGNLDPSSGVFTPEGNLMVDNGTAFFAFNVLPTVIFFSSLMTILYHYGIMQKVVELIARIMAKTMGTSGSESLNAAANIFVGQTEAPLIVKPFVEKMTKSELMAIMTGGFATIAGGVLAAYVGFLKSSVPDIAGHLVAASVMSAPAALVMAKIIFPETERSATAGTVRIKMEKIDSNGIEAASRGAADGMKLALNIAAMLIAFLAIVALINLGLGVIDEDLTLASIFGKVFAPVAFLMGVPWKDALNFGDLIGTKLMINEFVAYLKLQSMASSIEPRTEIIGAYALCGFANLGSIGIQLGGIGSIAPSRRGDLAKIAVRAMFGGAFASFTTACVAGILL